MTENDEECRRVAARAFLRRAVVSRWRCVEWNAKPRRYCRIRPEERLRRMRRVRQSPPRRSFHLDDFIGRVRIFLFADSAAQSKNPGAEWDGRVVAVFVVVFFFKPGNDGRQFDGLIAKEAAHTTISTDTRIVHNVLPGHASFDGRTHASARAEIRMLYRSVRTCLDHPPERLWKCEFCTWPAPNDRRLIYTRAVRRGAWILRGWRKYILLRDLTSTPRGPL